MVELMIQDCVKEIDGIFEFRFDFSEYSNGLVEKLNTCSTRVTYNRLKKIFPKPMILPVHYIDVIFISAGLYFSLNPIRVKETTPYIWENNKIIWLAGEFVIRFSTINQVEQFVDNINNWLINKGITP